MRKVFRLAVIVLVLQGLTMVQAEAGRAVACRSALERCLSQCGQFPAIFREGCMLGCGIAYLSCEQ
jgi:hypothetical protein